MSELPENLLSILERHDLRSFLRRSFTTVNPGTEYQHNWHIDLIADHLTACENGDIKRLIINLPPRYLKSLLVNVAWPAWLLGQDPTRRIISASYSQDLANKHSLDSRLIMRSDWYGMRYPGANISSGQDEKNKFVTTKRGFRLATSVGGTLTGEGGNFLILDDPHNPTHTHSKRMRENTIEWYEKVFASRLDNKKQGVIVIIMQRLHAEDLTGHLLGKNSSGWHVLSIPAYAAEDRSFPSPLNNGDAFSYPAGAVLHESREDLSMLKQIEAELGTFNFAAQYLQSPLHADNGLIKREWLKYYRIQPVGLTHITQSWDMAVKAGDNNDYSSCTTWGETENAYYLLDVFRDKLEYPALKHAVLNQAEKWQPEKILIEDKSSGQSLLQDLNSETRLPLIAINPKYDKFVRFASVTALLESGRVVFPEKAPWLSDFELELFSFPHYPHDDSVDSFSQYLNWARVRKLILPNIRRL